MSDMAQLLEIAKEKDAEIKRLQKEQVEYAESVIYWRDKGLGYRKTLEWIRDNAGAIGVSNEEIAEKADEALKEANSND